MKKEPEKIEVKSEKAWAFTVLFTLIAVGCILLDGYFMGRRAYMSELHTNPEIPAEFLVAIAALGFCSGLAAFVIAVIKLFKAKSGRDARLALLAILLILFVGFGSLGAAVLNMESRTNAGIVEAQKRERENNPKPYKPAFDKYDNGPADAQEMLELVNKERVKVGVAPLKIDERLNASAQEKANDMQARDYYGHESPDGIEGFSLVFRHMPGKCRYASENLATLLVPISNSRKAIDGWMSSTKGHREAILDKKYDLVGFGIAKDKHGNSLVVQHFCELNK